MSETLAVANRPDLTSFLELVGDELKKTFPNRFRSLYSIGSIAHGDYSETWSDINLVGLFNQPIPEQQVLQFRQKLWRYNPKLGARLLFHWSDELLTTGDLPLLAQLDFFNNRQCLTGAKLNLPSYLKPQLPQIQNYIREESFLHWQGMAHHYSELSKIDPHDKGFLLTLLMPARLLATFTTGNILAWHKSVNFVIENFGEQEIFGVELTRALNYRFDRIAFNKISPLKKTLPQQYQQLALLL